MEGVCTRIISGSMNKSSKKITWLHTDIKTNPESFRQFRNINESINCYKQFEHIITVSKEAQSSFKEIIGMDATVIPNPIDKKDIIEKSQYNSELVKLECQFIAIGRLEAVKGFDRLLRVAKHLIEEGYNFNLRIVGEGSLMSQFQAFIESNSLNNHIHLLGFQSNPYAFLGQSDLLISSSLVEGYPLVIIEAMILGIPVLATSTAGSIEILGQDNVIDNDEKSLYESLKLMLSDPNILISMRQKAETFAKSYDPTYIIKRIEQLLD